jgi:thioredoxin-like negative regulator of GroEL
MRPLNQDGSILSLQGGQSLMGEASNAISSQNYTLAAKKLQDARQVFNQLSNFYLQLSSSFSGIDNRIYEAQRKKALETAEKRDEATYQLALVHRAQNQPELAVPLLIQIIRSQNPTRDLGKKAYQQLFELGFVDSPYPKPRSGESTSSTTPDK